MIKILTVGNLNELYEYQKKFKAPYFYETGFADWESSLNRDVDGENRRLFSELYLKGAYSGDKLIGFIQYGKSCFGYDENDEITDKITHNIIRSLYFDEDEPEAGRMLLNEALEQFGGSQIRAFTQYFGKSCYARHGKLFESFGYIEKLLNDCGFITEHESVYYSSALTDPGKTDINLLSLRKVKAEQESFDFELNGGIVGGCEVQYLPQGGIAYLRSIYINDGMQDKGVGTDCINALRHELFSKGIRRLDSDAALSAARAQHFYEKNGFTRDGVTKSLVRE